MQHQSEATTPEIDERWIGEWFQFGLREIEAHLRKHAEFEKYYARTRS